VQFTYITQFAATYGCKDSVNQAYGAGSYGTCSGSSLGAPNTGGFGTLVDSANLVIILPIVIAITLAIVATIVVKRKKRA
jgi:hypothetical protein